MDRSSEVLLNPYASSDLRSSTAFGRGGSGRPQASSSGPHVSIPSANRLSAGGAYARPTNTSLYNSIGSANASRSNRSAYHFVRDRNEANRAAPYAGLTATHGTAAASGGGGGGGSSVRFADAGPVFSSRIESRHSSDSSSVDPANATFDIMPGLASPDYAARSAAIRGFRTADPHAPAPGAGPLMADMGAGVGRGGGGVGGPTAAATSGNRGGGGGAGGGGVAKPSQAANSGTQATTAGPQQPQTAQERQRAAEIAAMRQRQAALKAAAAQNDLVARQAVADKGGAGAADLVKGPNDPIFFNRGMSLNPQGFTVNNVQTLMRNLRKDVTFADVVFYVGDAHDPVHAHRAVLANVSPVFKTMFTKSPSTTEFAVPNTTPAAFGLILDWCYSMSMQITLQDAMDLLPLGTILQLQSLVGWLEMTLNQHLCVENAAWMYEGAVENNSARLKTCCLNFIVVNFNAVSETRKFQDLDREPIVAVLQRRSELARMKNGRREAEKALEQTRQGA